jgi:hypothetical protein
MDINLQEQLIEYIQNLSEDELKEIIEFKTETQPEKEPEKIFDCAHEIIFNITANAMTLNEKQETTGTREICNKMYHIPVPIDKDYKEYMNAFFSYLEEKIIDTAKHTNDTLKSKE